MTFHIIANAITLYFCYPWIVSDLHAWKKHVVYVFIATKRLIWPSAKIEHTIQTHAHVHAYYNIHLTPQYKTLIQNMLLKVIHCYHRKLSKITGRNSFGDRVRIVANMPQKIPPFIKIIRLAWSCDETVIIVVCTSLSDECLLSCLHVTSPCILHVSTINLPIKT